METKTAGILRWIIPAAVFLAVFFFLFFLALNDATQKWDETLSALIYEVRAPGLNTLVEGITYLGNWQSIVVLCLLLLALEKLRHPYGIPVAAAAICATVFRIIIKEVVERPRPQELYRLIEETGWSFPSGHATASMAVFGLLALLLIHYSKNGRGPVPAKGIRRGGLIACCAFLSFAIGVSRIYLGVHYPVDMIAGWLAGAAVACLVMALLVRRERKDEAALPAVAQPQDK